MTNLPSLFGLTSSLMKGILGDIGLCERRCFRNLDSCESWGRGPISGPSYDGFNSVNVHNRPFMAALTTRDCRFSVF